jgi:multiple sugar transport system substrate-binding protein
MREVFAEFEKQNPGITVNYQQQSPKDYRERLQSAIAAGRGPDVYRFHASWVPMLQRELNELNDAVSAADFQATYQPAAVAQLVVGGKIAGIPLMYDGLALLYNVDMLKTANATPPTTWADLKRLASELRLPKETTQPIQRAGVALGNATNVEHFSDILGLLLLQNGADPLDPTSQAAQDALLFYTNFVKSDRVWNAQLPASTVAFARGDVAMIFAPSWRIHEIRAMNPSLKFGVAPVPQLGTTKMGWGTYWAEGMSAQSKYKKESLKLLGFLHSAAAQRLFFSAASKVRAFGEIPGRKDVATEVGSDPLLTAYLSDAPVARDWWLNSSTFDNGVNDQIIKYYEDAVTAILGGKEIKETMNTVKSGTTQVLRQYGIPTK